MRRSPLFALVAVLAFAPALAAQPSNRLTLADYLEWEGVGNPQLSPDGSQIIYSRNWIDKLNDRRQSSIYIMNADGSNPQLIARLGDPYSRLIWSPDGDRIAFVLKGAVMV
ncbi:MAG TPA: hypothetical protein VIH11_00135, partial [Gemmatimonadaceae bacterium]